MRSVILTLFLCGCGSLSQSIEAAKKPLKGVDIALDETSTLYVDAMEKNIEHCRSLDLETKEERERCLRAFSNRHELLDLAEQASEVYDALVEQLEALEEIAKQLEPQVKKALKGAKR